MPSFADPASVVLSSSAVTMMVAVLLELVKSNEVAELKVKPEDATFKVKVSDAPIPEAVIV